jgi:hypothetical protein
MKRNELLRRVASHARTRLQREPGLAGGGPGSNQDTGLYRVHVRVDSLTVDGALDVHSNTDHFINLGQEEAKTAETIAKVQALFLNDGPAPPWQSHCCRLC